MDNIQNFVHALSQVEPYNMDHRLETEDYLESTPEHVQLLDGISLLLVFAPREDVAATTFWVTQKEITLLWAKNTEVTEPNELGYIEKLFHYVKNGENMDKMLDIVIPACRAKILGRFKALAQQFDPSVDNWHFTQAANEALKEAHKTFVQCSLIKPKDSLIDHLNGFVSTARLLTKGRPDFYFSKVLRFAWTLCTRTSLEAIVDPKKLNRINKVGDYCRILWSLAALKAKMEKTGQKMSIFQVIPPKLRSVEVYSSTVDALNHRFSTSHIQGRKIPGFHAIKAAYPNATQGVPPLGKKFLDVTQHCELTIVLHILNNLCTKPRSIGLGMSRRCCGWCHQWLSLLEAAVVDQNFEIIRRATNCKQLDGWGMPLAPLFKPTLTGQMEKLIYCQADQILCIIRMINSGSDSDEVKRLSTSELEKYNSFCKELSRL